MLISFSSSRLQKLCNSQKEMQAKFGARMSSRLAQRLSELQAIEILEDISKLPSARCHELHHNREGQIAIDLIHPKRLVFVPDHHPTPTKPDGGLDWSKVSRITIVEIIDYH